MAYALHLVFGLIGAFIVGALIAIQGICNRALGRYFDGSYQHAGFFSLLVSSAIFLLWALLRRLSRPLYVRLGVKYEPLNVRALLGRGVSRRKRLKYLCSGVAGACFVVVYAMTINLVTSAVAGPVGIAGILSVSVWMNRTADKGRRYVLGGAGLIVVAMILVSISSFGNPQQEAPWWLQLLGVALTFLFGIGVGRQLLIIKEMRVVSSSGLSAAIVSSLSGLVTEGLLVVGFAMWPWAAWPLLPSQPLPELFGNMWMIFWGGPSGFGLIYIGAFAAAALVVEYGDKLGPAVYLSVLGLGLLTVSFIFGFDPSSSLLVMSFQIPGTVLTVAGIYLCILKIGRLRQQSAVAE